MLYFFLLPLYLLGLGVLLVATGISFFNSRLRPWITYLMAAAIGSVAGFVIAYAALFFSAVSVTTLPLPGTSQAPRSFVAVAVPATIFIGPFMASAIGILLGSFLGVLIVWRLKRRKYT